MMNQIGAIMIDNDIIRKLLTLNRGNDTKLVLNDNYSCEFSYSNDNGYFFSDFVKDNNCPRMTCYANVIVYDEAKSKKHFGKVCISHDLDLGNNGKYSLILYIADDNYKTMYSISKCVIANSATHSTI